MASGDSGFQACMMEFCLDLFKHIAKESSAENAFLSPSSIIVVMAMINMGAKGNTLNQMSKVLRLEYFKQKSAHVSFGEFMQYLKKENESFILKSANRLFPHKDKTILDQYLNSVTKHYLTDIQPMDFTSQSEESRLVINKWVEKETNDRIKDLLAPGTITPLTAMVVVNAIYFKGSWATQFDKESTAPDTFFTQKSGSVQVDMMNSKMKNVGFSRNEELACSVLELPYKGNQLSMLVLLPDKRFGLSEFEEKLTMHTFEKLISSLRKTTVQVSLPKFKLETSYKLNAVLSSLGMPDLFDEDKADLSGMSKEKLYVSHVAHKAFVDVNEEGTEAAAATAAVVMKRSIQITPTFRADHPFLFVIFDKTQHVPLFIGRMVSPSTGVNQQQREEL